MITGAVLKVVLVRPRYSARPPGPDAGASTSPWMVAIFAVMAAAMRPGTFEDRVGA